MSVLTKNQISLAGEFAVLSQLALQGFDANMTLGNAKSVDILLTHPETKSVYRLEVKTHSNSNSYRSSDFGFVASHWRMHKKHETIEDENLFYCFVSIEHNTKTFSFYVVPSRIVAKFIRESHQHWLKGGTEETRQDSDLRSFMLGTREENYKIDTPLVEDYKDNWNQLK